jgi:signal transduction histidine kinase
VRLSVSLDARRGILGPEEEIVVDVVDDGRGAAARDDGEGYGLVGMRQRLDVHGGELSYGAAPGGGFRLRARIPVDGRR